MSESVIEDVAKEKSEDKKDIEMEEREKMLNAENKALEEKTEEKKTPEKEGMEVKPKKIPIGGIQMPGFFTRSKSKEKCKDEEQVEGADLIEAKPETQRIKLPNPFRKSKVNTEDENEKASEAKDRKRILDTIRLPLVSVFPRLKKSSPEAQAGLASMETLDDKSTDGKQEEKSDKDLEQQMEENVSWKQKLKTYRIAISALLVFILLIIIIIIIAIPKSEMIREVPIRDGKYVETVTSCGKVEGLVEDSAVAFRGIPYARPPINDLRFRPAQRLNHIDYCWNGTLLAHNATDVCLQIYSNGSVTGSEDCLTLDVVTPYVRYENPLPVIVLIGAESLIGGSPGKMRPSTRIARSRDVVFVRPNFRLGALGFLSLDILSQSEYPPISGNYGLSDILEALKWIQLNIEHFGGDPRSVVLFGHQAGATLVTALATIKDSDKYFSRVWATSGGALYPKKQRSEAELDNASFLKIVDCETVDCLRKLDAAKLVGAIEDTWRKPQPDLPAKAEDPNKRHEWLVLDGNIIREHPATVWAKEEPLPVKLVIGTTAHSAASQKLLLKHTNWTESLVKAHIEDSFIAEKNLTSAVLERYPATYKGLITMISDIRTVCPLFAITTQMYKVPFYVVTETRGPEEFADADSDVDAILGRYEPKTPEQRRYVQSMQAFFYHFVAHGKVQFQDELIGQKILVIGQDVLPNSTYSHCAFWINKNIVLPYAALD